MTRRKILDCASAFYRDAILRRVQAIEKARKLRLRQVKHIWGKFVHYVRTDFKEIVVPSRLPPIPGYKPPYRPRMKDIDMKALRQAAIWYKQTWTGEYSEPGYNEKKEGAQGKENGGKAEPSVLEDLAAAAQLGGEHLKPALQRIYMTKVGVYRDALRHFVDGYKQGLNESIEHTRSVMEKSAKEEAERVVQEAAAKKARESQQQSPGKP